MGKCWSLRGKHNYERNVNQRRHSANRSFFSLTTFNQLILTDMQCSLAKTARFILPTDTTVTL